MATSWISAVLRAYACDGCRIRNIRRDLLQAMRAQTVPIVLVPAMTMQLGAGARFAARPTSNITGTRGRCAAMIDGARNPNAKQAPTKKAGTLTIGTERFHTASTLMAEGGGPAANAYSARMESTVRQKVPPQWRIALIVGRIKFHSRAVLACLHAEMLPRLRSSFALSHR